MQIGLYDYKESIHLQSREKRVNTHEEAERKGEKKRKEKVSLINFKLANLLIMK